MYVCICYGVTDNEVNAEIALGARSVEEIGDRCDAGTACGSCLDRVDGLLEAAERRRTAGCCGTGCGAFCTPQRQAAARTGAAVGARVQ
jgi:bacterioferritin-associated ferredoxin